MIKLLEETQNSETARQFVYQLYEVCKMFPEIVDFNCLNDLIGSAFIGFASSSSKDQEGVFANILDEIEQFLNSDICESEHYICQEFHDMVEDKLFLQEILAELSPYERFLIDLYFVEEMDEDEVGTVIGATAFEVSEMLNDVIGKLQEMTND